MVLAKYYCHDLKKCAVMVSTYVIGTNDRAAHIPGFRNNELLLLLYTLLL